MRQKSNAAGPAMIHALTCPPGTLSEYPRSKAIAPVELAGESPQIFPDADLMQQPVCLAEVEAKPEISVTLVVVAAPKVKETHRSTRLRCAIDPFVVE
jgi:hypothetical protein